ncbi:cytochrome c oxidase subunit 2A [Paenibacillus senegalensis]|uniref:cytochrome c oxidase subunit 2A n=1 Tax=Paenibacillus senegalensis TaxID=1465766 RepID=UPI0002EAAF67|nr:cytochrome c oxidase subunit 2A [Paenibacillus senegalensis]
MNNPMTPQERKERSVPGRLEKEESPLKGTLAAVMILGGFLFLTWLGIFILFLLRS